MMPIQEINMRKSRLSQHLLAALPALALVPFASQPAMAQDIADQSPQADAQEGEIIVTARKRNESILKVPVVLTAITQESLERFANDDLYTVAQNVPGLLIGTSLAANGLQVSMRGIGTTANNATVDN